MKKANKKFSINKTVDVIGYLLILPFFIVLFAEIFSRILEGDLFHHSRKLFIYLSKTPLYSYPILSGWKTIFPILIVIMELTVLITELVKNKHNLLLIFIKNNYKEIALILIAITMYIYFH